MNWTIEISDAARDTVRAIEDVDWKAAEDAVLGFATQAHPPAFPHADGFHVIYSGRVTVAFVIDYDREWIGVAEVDVDEDLPAPTSGGLLDRPAPIDIDD